jgi:ATP-binding cassette, subfamily B, multidrug efflux pump
MRIVGSYLGRHWLVYLAGVALVTAGSLFAALLPRLLGRVTDRLQHGTLGIPEMAGCVGLICLLGVLRVASGWTGRIIVHRKGRILTYRLRRELLAKWGTLSPAYYQRHSVGDLLSHALSDVEVVRELVSQGINMSVSGLSMLLGVMYLMAVQVQWRLTLAVLGPLLAIPLLVAWLGPKIRRQSQRSQEALGSMAQTVEEVIGGIRAVKAFGNEQVVIGRFRAKVDAIVVEKMRLVRLSSLFGALTPLMVNLGFVAVLGYGGYLVAVNSITLGDFVAFTLYLAMLRMPMEQLGNVLNIVQRSAASLERIDRLLQVVPQVRDREGALQDRPLQGELRVDRLSFRYPGSEREALCDISFSVRPGQTLGIIGPMGSGKSTLADLLLRLHDPPEGTVRFDGCDILDYPLARLREGIAYVPQDGFLFSSTVLDNIGFADNYPDRERAEACALITAVHANIVGFPEGYDTEVGERGVRMSGGQKQRVAIARMIYKDAPFQILDDSLSAVDTDTERQILQNLREMGIARADLGQVRPKVTIIVSHRLSAVQHADQILVLEQGRIVERGSHAELLARGGSYAEQWCLQSGTAAENESTAGEELGQGESFRPDLEQEMASLESGQAQEAV